MLLKIFIKRKPHGELCSDKETVTEEFYEGRAITKEEMPKGSKAEGFSFCVHSTDAPVRRVYCLTAIQGYELLNDAGVSVAKYITAINEKEIEKFYEVTENKAILA